MWLSDLCVRDLHDLEIMICPYVIVLDHSVSNTPFMLCNDLCDLRDLEIMICPHVIVFLSVYRFRHAFHVVQ